MPRCGASQLRDRDVVLGPHPRLTDCGRPGFYRVTENLVIARPLPPDQISKPA
jgi:hypothetical protein